MGDVRFARLLADETWDAVFAHTAALDLHTLSLVCRRFRPIAQSRLFETVSFQHYALEALNDSPGDAASIARRAGILLRREIDALSGLAESGLAGSVREMTVMHPQAVWSDDWASEEGLLYELGDAFTEVLASGVFANLAKLSLIRFDIDANMRDALLRGLPRLGTLNMAFCQAPMMAMMDDGTAQLRVRNTSIVLASDPEEIDDGVAAGQLLSLLCIESLVKLSLSPAAGEEVLPALIRFPELSALRSLTLRYCAWQPEELSSLLLLCHELTELRLDIRWPTPDVEALAAVFSAVPATTLLPRLKVLAVREELIPSLASNRPLTDLTISFNSPSIRRGRRGSEPLKLTAERADALMDINPVLRAIEALPRTVRNLTVDRLVPVREFLHVQILAALCKYTPELDSLAMQFFGVDRQSTWLGLDGEPNPDNVGPPPPGAETNIALLRRLLLTGVLTYPPKLTKLRLSCYLPFCTVNVKNEHSAIAALEAVCPSFRVISFCDCRAKAKGVEQRDGLCWQRDGDVWSKRMDIDGEGHSSWHGGDSKVEWAETMRSRVERKAGHGCWN
uniref:F-box domain-containing protein n=1 Tax=Mycena chlorophos TaxID=658473 RepID=A0ABQ0LJW1_MYCCL|nr:predicted protein [Mycena chlorophos]